MLDFNPCFYSIYFQAGPPGPVFSSHYSADFLAGPEPMTDLIFQPQHPIYYCGRSPRALRLFLCANVYC